MAGKCLLLHRWVVVERIGRVEYQCCSRCGKTRIRVL